MFSLREIRETVLSRTTLLMSLADASSYALYSAVTSWLPTYYNEVMGFSLTQVGLITGFLPFAGLIAVLIGGAMAVKFQRRKPLLLMPGIFMAVAAVGSFITGNLAIIYPSVFLLGFMSWFWPPILFSIPMELPDASPEKVAMVWGTVGTLASIMAFISPLTVGAMTDALGSYVPGFSLWAGFSLFFLLAVLLLPETGRPGSLGHGGVPPC
jgi:sugar phosphate permease